MIIEGVDYTTAQRPTVASLKATGKRFACRYGGPGGTWKQVDLLEVMDLTAAGIAIVANAEGTADGLKSGRSAGIAWAISADAYFKRLGMPADRPIYFSVDFNTISGDWPALDAAFDGIASVIGVARVGVYGEYSIVRHLAANGKAKWFWQTYAWSSGQWYGGNHIEQYRNGVTLGGGTVDLDRALRADYGQWGVTTPRQEGEDMAKGAFYQVKKGGAGYDGKVWYLPTGGSGRVHVPDLATLGRMYEYAGTTEIVQVDSATHLDLMAPLPMVPTLTDAQLDGIVTRTVAGVVDGLDAAGDADVAAAVKQALREGTGTVS